MPVFSILRTWLGAGATKGKQEEDMSDSSPKSSVHAAGRRWPRAIVTGAVLIVAIALLTAIYRIPVAKQEVGATEVPPVDVSVTAVCAEAQLPDAFDLPAAVEPNRVVTLAAEVAGSVERLPR